MNEESKNIKELIQDLAKDKGEEIYSKICKVDSVDESKRTCDASPIDDGAKIFDIRLQSVTSSTKGLVMIPKVDSFIIVTFLGKNTAFVSLFDDVDKILIDCDEITFNQGNFGGWFKAPKVNEEINKLKDRITALESALTSFANTQAGAASPTPLTPLSAGFSALSSSMTSLPAQGEFNNDLIDDKIKH